MSELKIKITRQRKIILEELKKVASHPGADKIYEMVRLKLPKISLGTVYRNLEILAKYNIIKKLEFGSSQKRFDGNPENHFHIRCLNCGIIDDLFLKKLNNLKNILPKEDKGYKIIGYNLEIIGLCSKCKLK